MVLHIAPPANNRSQLGDVVMIVVDIVRLVVLCRRQLRLEGAICLTLFKVNIVC